MSEPTAYDQQVAALFKKLVETPETRESVLSAIKKVEPNRAIPELDAKNALLAQLEPKFNDITKQFSEFSQKYESDQNAAFIERNRNRLSTQGRSQAEIDGIEKLMQERGFSKVDYEAAEALYDRLNPPSQPALDGGYQSSFFNMGVAEGDNDADSVKLLFADPERWADQQVGKMRSARR